MYELQNPENQLKTDSENRSVEMKSAEQTNGTVNAPLYSSPWLAFFYIIRQGWSQPRP